MAGQIVQDTELPITKRVDAAHDLGILGYTGSYAQAKHTAAQYMPNIVELLRTPKLSDDHIIRVLEALSGLCFFRFTNQNKAQTLGLYYTLLELMAPASNVSTTAKRWSCYLLNILCCNNIQIINHLRNSKELQINLEQLAILDWGSWPSNYPQELLSIIGFRQSTSQDVFHEETEF
ncbi:armadillo-like helical domain-containing protein 2 [Myxocyprinus asiaticus]|uniref:armadillo-like helical domain-containing protein 2 n=1 Tax=Myxocyprinus asiaticus TaxID=70543 RepID=UPI0022230703|nr:armadillo-like helical domain-containing protein 2 [Myxocyprinus asiaticus]